MATSIGSVESFLNKWSSHVSVLTGVRPTFVLSKHGLDTIDLNNLTQDYANDPFFNGISTIISMKMMHIYFRIGQTTYDYRPHRGPLSSLSVSPYRAPKGERVEVLMRFTPAQMENLFVYLKNIKQSRVDVLGIPHPLQFTEHDYTVRSYQTTGRLDCNTLLHPKERHNCLTWFTTAPIGSAGERIYQILGMSEAKLQAEAHSYIVAFHRFLLEDAQLQSTPYTIIWTNDPLEEAVRKVKSNPSYLIESQVSAASTV